MAFVFIDENPWGIDDGSLFATPLDRCGSIFGQLPQRGRRIVLCDGHAEIKKWKDGAVLNCNATPPLGVQQDPRTGNLVWLQERSSSRHHNLRSRPRADPADAGEKRPDNPLEEAMKPINGHLALTRPLSIIALAGLGCLLLPGYSCPGAEIAAAELQKAEQVRRLTTQEAERRVPVRLRGVVTFFDENLYSRFVQDDTAGIYLQATNLPPLTAGQLIEVEGVTGPGEYAPIVVVTQVKVVGEGKLPAAKPVALEQLVSGQEDSQFVEVVGLCAPCASKKSPTVFDRHRYGRRAIHGLYERVAGVAARGAGGQYRQGARGLFNAVQSPASTVWVPAVGLASGGSGDRETCPQKSLRHPRTDY